MCISQVFGGWKSQKSVENQIDFKISYMISASAGPLANQLVSSVVDRDHALVVLGESHARMKQAMFKLCTVWHKILTVEKIDEPGLGKVCRYGEI